MKDKLYIDGGWVAPASGEMFDVLDPSSRAVFHRAPRGTAEDIDRR